VLKAKPININQGPQPTGKKKQGKKDTHLKVVEEDAKKTPLDLNLADSLLDTLSEKLEILRVKQRSSSDPVLASCVELIDVLLHDICDKIDSHTPIIDETVLPVDQMQQIKIMQLETDLSASQAKVVELQGALADLYEKV
jgi:hypothetical protein